MSAWPIMAAMCFGKAQFSTPQLANKVKRRRERRSKQRKGQETYHCPNCGYFHIGTKAKSVHASLKRAEREQHGEDADMA
jgi:predicted RNA-binding Zn-ribbon protein involved in translation (DUF1610 family)